MEKIVDQIIKKLQPAKIIGITGSGGKTQSLIELATSYSKLGLSVLMTTTTKLELPENRNFKADKYFFDKSIFEYKVEKGEKILFAYKEKKLISPPLEEIEKLSYKFDIVLFEADGARNLPLKIHSYRDPVIPSFTQGVLSVVGFFPYNEELSSLNCFGDIDYKGKVDIDFYNYYLTLKEGPCKNLIKNSLVFFNQADIMEKQELKKVKKYLRSDYELIFGSMLQNKVY
ncbi:MAG: selenium cofactor biosynthesis protein YqeC [Sphaerochaetaceae bacterium]|nr:selenium cofactor biosynthesis protein YqeC [Sphaerochaetaceae bacterium]